MTPQDKQIEALELSRESLLNSSRFEDVRKLILDYSATLDYAYLLLWVPDKESDFYHIIIDSNNVFAIEMSKDLDVKPVVLQAMDVNLYRKSIYKSERRKLAIAEKLIREKKKQEEKNK